MLRIRRSLGSVFFACLVVLSVLSTSTPVFADSSGGSVIITATIAPVREIVVNDRGVILEILSNTSEDVVPSAYRNRPDTNPTVLTPAIYSSYKSVMRHIDTRRTGVIYRNDTGKVYAGRHTGLLSLVARQSVLVMFR